MITAIDTPQPLQPKFNFEAFYQIITSYVLTLENFAVTKTEIQTSEVISNLEDISTTLTSLNKKYLEVNSQRTAKQILKHRATRTLIILDGIIKIDSYEEALNLLALIIERIGEFFTFLITRLKENEQKNSLIAIKLNVDEITMRLKKLYKIFGGDLGNNLLGDGAEG